MVIEPADGRVPPMTDEGQRRLRELRGTFANGNFNAEARFKGPEDLSLWERCITRGVPSAIFPTVYNANTRIVQAPGVVAITYEMIHDTRIVFTDGRDARGRRRFAAITAIRAATGKATRWWWTSPTSRPKTDYRGARETLHLVERFTRTADRPALRGVRGRSAHVVAKRGPPRSI